jgi:hypothetical protein
MDWTHVGRDLFHSLCNAPYKRRRKVFVRFTGSSTLHTGKVSWSIFQRFFVCVCASVAAPTILARVGEPCLSRRSCRQQQTTDVESCTCSTCSYIVWYVQYSSTVSTSVVLCCAVLCCAVVYHFLQAAELAELKAGWVRKYVPLQWRNNKKMLSLWCCIILCPFLDCPDHVHAFIYPQFKFTKTTLNIQYVASVNSQRTAHMQMYVE